MSWRQFSVYLQCLSPNSATINHLMAGEYIGSKHEDVVAVDTPAAAEAAFIALMPVKPKK
jgi:hypothetical protein